MSVKWQRRVGGKTYEVRTAGASLRLYTNGAFHSQYNPKHLFTNAVWDLLTLPVLFTSRRIRTVNILGVGGGTAIHQLNKLCSPKEITGIELDPVHLEVARRYFNADAANVTLIRADALDWIKRQRRRFDVIIDDIFVDAIGDPERPSPVDDAWFDLLGKRTTRHGIVVQNHLSPALARGLAHRHEQTVRRHFRSAMVLTRPNYENGILALFKDGLRARNARQRAIERIRAIDRSAARTIEFSVRQIF